nr:hypothetical protein [Kutzneria buriramensis]WKX09168.1 hypothetical protein Q4V64_17375 [Kutzneria buriramensis]
MDLAVPAMGLAVRVVRVGPGPVRVVPGPVRVVRVVPGPTAAIRRGRFRRRPVPVGLVAPEATVGQVVPEVTVVLVVPVAMEVRPRLLRRSSSPVPAARPDRGPRLGPRRSPTGRSRAVRPSAAVATTG